MSETEKYPGPPPAKRKRENVKPGQAVYVYMSIIDDEADQVLDDWTWLIVRGKHGDLYECVILDQPESIDYGNMLPRGMVVFIRQEHIRDIANLEGGVGAVCASFLATTSSRTAGETKRHRCNTPTCQMLHVAQRQGVAAA